MLDERDEPAGDRVTGRFTARDRQEKEEHVEFGLAQLGVPTIVGLDLDGREKGPDVVLWCSTLAPAEVLCVFEHLDLDRRKVVR